eukprot:scaffold85625_cov90-Phaeocystis_antarctica.AAC.1
MEEVRDEIEATKGCAGRAPSPPRATICRAPVTLPLPCCTHDGRQQLREAPRLAPRVDGGDRRADLGDQEGRVRVQAGHCDRRGEFPHRQDYCGEGCAVYGGEVACKGRDGGEAAAQEYDAQEPDPKDGGAAAAEGGHGAQQRAAAAEAHHGQHSAGTAFPTTAFPTCALAGIPAASSPTESARARCSTNSFFPPKSAAGAQYAEAQAEQPDR